jgi:uncharacterized damage-inducible protein DinB
MNVSDLLADALGRVREQMPDLVADLSDDDLAWRPDPEANSIAWLVWHLTRVQDDHIADAAGTPQAWTSRGWAERFALPFSVADTGYGHGGEQVAAVRVESADLLTGYHDAVHEQTIDYIAGLADDDLNRIVDRAWDPPVTLGVRLVSVISDDLQHAGQAAFVRGIITRR